MRRVLVGVLVVAAVALIGYGIGSYVLFDKISAVAAHCGDRSGDGPRFQENTPAGWTLANDGDVDVLWPTSSRTLDVTPYLMPDYIEVTISSRDTSVGPLSAWWVPGRTPDAPAVVVVHGGGACKKDHVALLHAGMLHRAGFGVLLFDQRDMGESAYQDGRWAAGTQEYLDVLGARDWLVEAQGVPVSRVGLIGNSGGAMAVVIAAGMDATVAATWEDSGIADLNQAIREEIAFQGFPDAVNLLVPGGLLIGRMVGFDPLSISPLDMASAIGNRPFAVVHGELDPKALVHHATDLAAVVARSVPGYTPWLVPCAHHVEAAFCATSAYESRLVAFFSEALGAP
jgi:dipeptidyl aminopeptidase/acylaminoacyl peptidase